jgi:hypothetical protein
LRRREFGYWLRSGLDGEQTLDLQLDAVQKAGCDKVHTETATVLPQRAHHLPHLFVEQLGHPTFATPR